MNILYIALKHVIWRFRIRNYSLEIFKFRDFMNNLRKFAKSVFVHIFAKFKYFPKQFILTESLGHVCKLFKLESPETILDTLPGLNSPVSRDFVRSGLLDN